MPSRTQSTFSQIPETATSAFKTISAKAVPVTGRSRGIDGATAPAPAQAASQVIDHYGSGDTAAQVQRAHT
jgi:hypothetical protein